MSVELMKVCAAIVSAQTLAFFHVYSQHVWQWWAGKPVLATIIFGLPASFLFWYSAKYAYLLFGEAWAVRLFSFGMSYVTFPFLAYLFLSEDPWSPKTLTCIALSVSIIGIQVFWK